MSGVRLEVDPRDAPVRPSERFGPTITPPWQSVATVAYRVETLRAAGDLKGASEAAAEVAELLDLRDAVGRIASDWRALSARLAEGHRFAHQLHGHGPCEGDCPFAEAAS